MCFKKPKAPSVSTAADPELYEQRVAAEQDNAVIKAENKRLRTEDQMALLGGRIGRKSLFTGGQGGIGFQPNAKSIFGSVRAYKPGHATPIPAMPPAGVGGGGGGGGRPGLPIYSGSDLGGYMVRSVFKGASA